MSIFNLIEENELENIKLHNEQMYTESINSLPEGEEEFIFESIIENESWFKKTFRNIIRFFKFRNTGYK